MEMNTDNILREENINLIFEAKPFKGEFIAEANDRFSVYSVKDEYNRDWALNFPSGRYVIIVYQRHSLYLGGVQVYKNEFFENTTGRNSRYKKPGFVLIVDKELEYTVPSWGNRKLKSHIVMNDKNPLHALIYSDIEKAEKAAVSYSKMGNKVGILEWYEDFDMY